MQLAKRPQEVRITVDALAVGDVTVGAQPTTPTRLTLSTPSENTVLSLGAAHKGRVIEAGLTGRTDNHMHLHVSATGKQTLTSLGSPSALDPHDAAAQWPAGFQSKVVSDTASSGATHCVYTTGASYQYSDGECRFVSVNGSALLRARGETGGWAALHADQGAALVMANDFVHVGSRTGVTIGTSALVDMPGPGDKLHYSSSVIDPTTSWGYVGQVKKTIDLVLTIAQGLFGFVSKIVQLKMFKFDAMKEMPTWIPVVDKGMTLAGTTLAVGGLVTKIVSGVSGPLFKQSVNVTADNCVSLFAGNSASAWGGVTASLGSGIAASVSSTLTSVSGLLTAGVDSGLSTSIGSQLDVETKALWGKATMRGGLRGVEISSPKAHAALAASKNVEVKSMLGKTFVVGTAGALLAAGTPPLGWGVEVQPMAVMIGQIPALVPYSAAKVSDMPTCIAVTPMGLGLSFGMAAVKINATGSEMKGPLIQIKADGITKVGGSMLMLGS